MGQNVNPRKVLAINSKFAQKSEEAFKENDLLFFRCLEKLLNMSDIKRNHLLSVKNTSFIVGETFKHRDASTKTVQYLNDNFEDILYYPSKEREITIPVNMFLLQEYILSHKLDDTTLTKNISATPMSIDIFWSVLYLLIIEPELGVELLNYQLQKTDFVYCFYIEFKGKFYVCECGWREGLWYLEAFEFNISPNFRNFRSSSYILLYA
jgi:hypothetical protein